MAFPEANPSFSEITGIRQSGRHAKTNNIPCFFQREAMIRDAIEST
jgi:hypothetical protein